jgi:hypothetical protein
MKLLDGHWRNSHQTSVNIPLDGEEKRARTATRSNALGYRFGSQKITIIVKTKKVCVGSRVIYMPTFENGLASSNVSTRVRRVAIYENLLDPEQMEVVANSRELAMIFGLQVELKDLAKTNIFGRFFDRLVSVWVAKRSPSVSLSGKAIALLASANSRRAS